MTEIFRTVLNMSITGAYIAAAIMLLRIPMKKLPKKYSYILWSILGIRLLCPFSFSSAVSLFNLVRPETSENTMTYVPVTTEHSPAHNVTTAVPDHIPAQNYVMSSTLPPSEPTVSTDPMQTVLLVCAAVWAAGVIIMLIYTLVSCIRVAKTVKDSEYSGNNIYVCDNIESPFVFGVIRPRIYVPRGTCDSDMRFIAAHEKTHIRRGDHIIKLFSMLIVSLHWFNPLVWISYRLMVKDMELSCDEEAVRRLDPDGNEDVRRDYAEALLNMSLKQNKLYGMLAFGESNIKARIKGVLSLKKPRFIAAAAAAAMLIIAAVCLLTNAKKDIPFEYSGKYASDECLYMTPISSFLENPINIYDFDGDTLTVTRNDMNDFPQTYPLSSKWSDFPYSDKEWTELFGFDAMGAADISGFKEKLYMKLSSHLSLMKMDNELWIVRSYADGIWNIYTIEPYYKVISALRFNESGLGSFEITETEGGYEVRSPLTNIYFFYKENDYDSLYVRRDIMQQDGKVTDEAVYPYLGGFNPYNTSLILADVTDDGTDDIIVDTYITGTGVVDNVFAVIDGKTMENIGIDRIAAEKTISEQSEMFLENEAFDSNDPYLSINMPQMDEKYIYPYYPDTSIRRCGGMIYQYGFDKKKITGHSSFVFIKDEEYYSDTYSADFIFEYDNGMLVPEEAEFTLPESLTGSFSAVVTGKDEDSGLYAVKPLESSFIPDTDGIYYVSAPNGEELKKGSLVEGMYTHYVKGESVSSGAYLGHVRPKTVMSPEDAVKNYLYAYDHMPENDGVSEVSIYDEDIRIGQHNESVIWQYRFSPLAEKFGLSEDSKLVQVIADYTVTDKNGSHSESSVIAVQSGENGFCVIDMFPHEPYETLCEITRVSETADDGMIQYYMAKPLGSADEVRIYSFAPYGPFKVGDTVTVSHNGRLMAGENADNRIFSIVGSDPDENTSDQDDTPMQQCGFVSEVYRLGEYGYDSSGDSMVMISFLLPSEWEVDGNGSAYIGENKIFEPSVPYPESEGINSDGFKTDMVMGREITVHEEKIGTENDPFRYYISRSVSDYYSDDGSYDSYTYVVSSGGYNLSLTFVSDAGINPEVIDTVLRSVNITPFEEKISYDDITTETVFDPETNRLDITIANGSDKQIEVWFYTDILFRFENETDGYDFVDVIPDAPAAAEGGGIPRCSIAAGETYRYSEDYEGLYNIRAGRYRTYLNMYYTDYGHNSSEERDLYFEVE